MPLRKQFFLPLLLVMLPAFISNALAEAKSPVELTKAEQEQPAAQEPADLKADEHVQIEAKASARQVLENEKKAEELLRDLETTDPDDLQAGRTPLAAMLVLTKAIRDQDYQRAAEFMDMRYLSEGADEMTGEEIVRSLSFMATQQNILDVSSLSDDPMGETDDGLPRYRDLLATINLSDKEVPIYLQRVPDGKGGDMWKISNATIQRVPEMWQELGFHSIASYLFNVLPDFRFMGMLNWQVLGVILSLVLAWIMSTVATWLANKLVQLIPNIFPMGIEHFFRRPLRIFLFINIAVKLIDQLGLSLKLRLMLSSSGLAYFAYGVLLMGIISLVRDYHIRRLQGLGQDNFAALLRPMSTMLKVVLIIVIFLIWAENVGYNMSTILAGLGVGSVAVALAAQKTLENLIGAITLYAARPISPGDFCRFGTVVGTVEEIGLRSTTLRTPNRTLVSIPNAVFASGEVENFTARDRIRYFRNVRVLAQNPNQIRVVLAKMREVLYSHPMVYPDTVSVRLDDIDDTAARVRLDAGIRTTDFQEYLAAAEDINLRFIQIVSDAGASLSGEGQLRIVRQEDAPGDSHYQYVDDMLALWREQDSAPFPDFSDKQIREMQNTLDYAGRT